MVVAVREPRTPGYRAQALGMHALSNAELLVVALNVTPVVAEQLAEIGNGSVRELALTQDRIPSTMLRKSKRQVLAAIFELGLRCLEEAHPLRVAIRSPRDVVTVFAPRLSELPVEEFHALILDSQHRLVRDVTVTRGILNSSLAHPREVFREAIIERAAALILVHNHPSGDPSPSMDDRNLTAQLVGAGVVLDIPVHDHIIIGRGGRYTSFAEAGLI